MCTSHVLFLFAGLPMSHKIPSAMNSAAAKQVPQLNNIDFRETVSVALECLKLAQASRDR